MAQKMGFSFGAPEGTKGSRRWTTPMLYMAYGIVAAGLFGVLLFPSERLSSFVVARMNLLVSPLSLTAENVGLRFPWHVELENITWHLEGNPVMTSKQMRIRPNIVSMVQKKVFTFGIDDWLNGTLAIMGARTNRNMTITSRLTDLSLETLSSIAALGDEQVSGTVDGAVTVEARPERPWLATVDVTMNRFRTTHPAAGQFGRSPVSGRVAGSVFISPRKINIKEMVIHSDLWNAEVSGALIPGRRLSASRLDLIAKLRGGTTSSASGTGRSPGPQKSGADLPNGLISFIIKGTLEKPSIQMSLAAD